jgi:hypothetical protein
MPKKSLPRRAIKYALISSSIIMFFVFYRILTSGAVGTVGEIAYSGDGEHLYRFEREHLNVPALG